MDARLSYIQNRANLFDPPPVLVAATSDIARARAARIVEASGFRVAGAFPIDETAERLRSQASVSAVWLQIDRDEGSPMEDAISVLNRDVAAQRYSAVVSAPSDLIDLLFARTSDGVQLLINPDDAECAAALAIATSGHHNRLRLSDISADKDSARLRQLSAEVNRIASTLARLSEGSPLSGLKAQGIDNGPAPPLAADTVRSVIRARRLRSKFFPEDLFADPAWDMMLDLLQAEIAGLQVQVSSLCIAAAVPPTTALRWLTSMTKRGLFVRRADPHDGRRVFIELSPDTSTALHRYFAEVKSASAV
jgi:hypothetical protein